MTASLMQTRKVAAFALAFTTASFAADSSRVYSEARGIWDQNKGKAEYQAYAAEFSQFNNHFHLDEKDGCYRLAHGPVELMLILAHAKGDEYAVVKQVLSDVDNLKARCFKQGGFKVEARHL
jgi:hypothetical protein